jgi:hypothetical protein
VPPDDQDDLLGAPRFLIDQNVHDAVHTFLVKLGYESTLVRDLSGPGTPDAVIAYVANSAGYVVVTHDRDFRDLSRLLPDDQRGDFTQGAGQLLLQVAEPDAVRYLSQEWQTILFHFRDAQRRGIRFQLKLKDTGVTVTTNAALPRRGRRR